MYMLWSEAMPNQNRKKKNEGGQNKRGKNGM